jgi:monomeric isocitrate dehydrogenase
MRHIKHKMAAQSPILRHFTGFIRRKLGTIDNRSSHFYLCLYWAQALAEQTADAALATTLKPIAEKLATAEKQIVQELLAVQEHLSRRSFSEGRPDGDDRTGSGCGC